MKMGWVGLVLKRTTIQGGSVTGYFVLMCLRYFEVIFLLQRQGVLEFGLGAEFPTHHLMILMTTTNKIIEHLSLRVSTEVEG